MLGVKQRLFEGFGFVLDLDHGLRLRLAVVDLGQQHTQLPFEPGLTELLLLLLALVVIEFVESRLLFSEEALRVIVEQRLSVIHLGLLVGKIVAVPDLLDESVVASVLVTVRLDQ